MTLAHDARPSAAVSDEMPLGDLVALYLAEIGVTTVFGVISIHNMPILDAIFAPAPHPIRAGARRSRRHEHGGCVGAHIALAWCRDHQHRHRGRQCRGVAG